MVIYQGKTDLCHPKYKFPEGWNVTHSENHWSNEQTMQEYTENVLIPYVENVVDKYPLRPHQIDVLFDGIATLIYADFILLYFKSEKNNNSGLVFSIYFASGKHFWFVFFRW